MLPSWSNYPIQAPLILLVFWLTFWSSLRVPSVMYNIMGILHLHSSLISLLSAWYSTYLIELQTDLWNSLQVLEVYNVLCRLYSDIVSTRPCSVQNFLYSESSILRILCVELIAISYSMHLSMYELIKDYSILTVFSVIDVKS